MAADQREDRQAHDGSGALEAGAPLRSWFGWLTMALNVVGTILILAMAVAVNADIFGRELFKRPIAGVNEFIGLAIVAVVFLQMANTLRENRHVSNDLILAWIGRTRPRVAHFFYGVFNLVGAALMGLIAWYVVPIFTENYAGDYYKGTAGIVEIPVWPFMAIVIVGSAVTVVQYFLFAARDFGRAFTGAAPGP